MERCIYCDLAITRCQMNLTRPTQPFSAYTQTAGVLTGMLGGKFKPGLLISALQILVFQSMGFTPQAVDVFFHTRAPGDGKAGW